MPIFPIIPLSEVWVTSPGAGAAGQGSSSTKIRRYTVEKVNTGSAITYADSSTLGGTFTINESGLYAIARADSLSSGAGACGISVNASGSDLTTDFESIASAKQTPVEAFIPAAGVVGSATAVVRLAAGDVLRGHDRATVMDATAASRYMRVMKIGN